MNTGFKSKLAAEFIGSALLVMAALGSRFFFVYNQGSPPYIAMLGNAISVGFVLFALIETFSPVSGAHFNPVVTGIMYLKKQISAAGVAKYMLAQLLGGMLGVFVTHLIFREQAGVILEVSGRVRGGQMHFSEFVATFILLITILVLGAKKSDKVSLAVGLMVGGQIIATSSTMFANPMVTLVRIFTPTVSGIRPVDAFIFVGMQIAGGLLAYIVYKIFFEEKEKGV